MRDSLLTAFIFALVPICVFRPWLGFVAWFWLGLMNPHRLTWDFAYTMPFAMVIGVATLVGIPFARDRKSIPWNTELVLMVVLLAYFTFTSFFAWSPTEAWWQLEKIAKIYVMTLLFGMFIYGRKRIETILFTIALSVGFYGFKGGIFSITKGGAERVEGPQGSFMEGNTFIGLALNMVLPLLLHLARQETRPWVRRFLFLTFGLSIISIIFTYSRGAYLGLAAILPLILLRARTKWLAFALFVPALVVAPYVLPERVFDRAEMIENYQEDGSANQRLQSWTVAWNIAKANPFYGAGLEFEYSPDNERWMSYGDRNYDRFISHSSAAHSIYFQILGQHGFVALLLFLAMLLSSVWRLGSLRKRAQTRPDLQWIAGAATALQIGLVGYMVSGTFLSSAYFDLAYLYYALGAILEREMKTEAAIVARKPTTMSDRLRANQLPNAS